MALSERHLDCAKCGGNRFMVRIVEANDQKADWWFVCVDCGRRFAVTVLRT